MCTPVYVCGHICIRINIIEYTHTQIHTCIHVCKNIRLHERGKCVCVCLDLF